jgi:membrane protein required for colicin V production
MGLIDILIWVVILAFAVKGFLKGLIREVCSLLGLVAGGWAACKYYPYLADVLRLFIRLPHHVAQSLAFVSIFLLLGLLFFLLGHLLTVVFKIMLLGGVNRIGGICFGLLEGAFVLCMLLYFATSKPVPEKVRGYIARSRTAQPLISTGREIVSGWDAGRQADRPAGGKGKERSVP